MDGPIDGLVVMDIVFDGVIDCRDDMVGFSDPNFDGAAEGTPEGRGASDG